MNKEKSKKIIAEKGKKTIENVMKAWQLIAAEVLFCIAGGFLLLLYGFLGEELLLYTSIVSILVGGILGLVINNYLDKAEKLTKEIDLLTEKNKE